LEFGVFESEHFDTQTRAALDLDGSARRANRNGEDVGWKSLLVQRFIHDPAVEDMYVPGSADVRLVLAEAGRATMEARIGGRRSRFNWVPGWLGLYVPDQPFTWSYRADGPLRGVLVHIPRGTVERTAEQLGGGAVAYERMAVSVEAGDPFLREIIRAVDSAAKNGVGDLYAESVAAFLAAHLVTHHSGRRARPVPPVREDARVRAVIALMRDRLAEPLTLADIAGEVYLSVFHLVRVFKEATGETPHRFLTKLRVEEAQRLLRDDDLSVAEIASRCGFASPGAFSTAFLRHTGVRPSTYRTF
jgi:AraC family transcriptional regulator